MRTAKDWKEFEVIDTSSGEKLERWGDVILARPDPQVIWNTPKGEDWKRGQRPLPPLHQRRRALGSKEHAAGAVGDPLQGAEL